MNNTSLIDLGTILVIIGIMGIFFTALGDAIYSFNTERT